MKKLIGSILLSLAMTAGCNTDIRVQKITESNKADIVEKILNNEAKLTPQETEAVKDYIAYKRMQSIGYGGTGKTSLPVGKTVGEAITLATQFQSTKAERDRIMDKQSEFNHGFTDWVEKLIKENPNISKEEYDKRIDEKMKEAKALSERLQKINEEMEKF